MIQHTAIFTLKHASGSKEETQFLEAIECLTRIPVVKNFKRLRQVSPRNKFSFGVSMEFASMEDYQTYNNHPTDTEFVAARWIPEITEFQEIDYTTY